MTKPNLRQSVVKTERPMTNWRRFRYRTKSTRRSTGESCDAIFNKHTHTPVFKSRTKHFITFLLILILALVCHNILHLIR